MLHGRSGYAHVEGASLYYEIAGEGPDLVFLHGFSFDSRLWDAEFQSFVSRFRVMRYDLRGFGKSKPGDNPYSHAGDLKALLDHLQIREAFFAGLSLGGGALINFSLLHPDMVKALILVAPSLGGFPWPSAVVAAQSSMVEKARERGVEVARAIWLRQTIFRQAMRRKDVAEKLRTMVAEYSGWHWVNPGLGMPLRPPAIERLGEINVPTLVLVGDEDAPDQLAIAETLERGIPHASRIVLKGAGHVLNLEEPEKFQQYVLEFLEKVKNY